VSKKSNQKPKESVAQRWSTSEDVKKFRVLKVGMKGSETFRKERKEQTNQ
jgi:hypothetical protein